MKCLPLILATLLTACSQGAPKAENTTNPAAARQTTLPLTIRTAKATHRFTVEVALTEKQQEQGLMFRKLLAPDGGMLFPMDPPRTASFWMKNTLIPLDMLFIHTDGSIAFLKASAAPYSREPVSAGIPVAAVLELRGGRAAELGIGEGDHVQWGDCTASAPASPLNFCPG
ncbi:DUF192 domain-containing protein [Sphingobium indicum]|uniref:DUF192 domain-containing protein n=2 Tax=Sphingobium indicum TaxID=332055 RepID=A0A1L5BU42_SPHIB|nr:DUF192 domain-containing protein [Sphingobium indicum]APL96381.1 hypothetical protein SIDU_13560 [Sphingobium indicum B90A]KEY98720.1 hypothetical protein AI27_09620 [Sphingomonas sp. BHC-A]NYI22574.1 hypothetical protein [Sphingobium indicum]RYM02442.1 DUF192 domain-containing protein [Sphingobium indicum]